ncbi:MAG TPA: EAL domain-containing protein [Pseudomonas sp.]|nr:EAL domain-containing protein [Pseudomonas sp.]
MILHFIQGAAVLLALCWLQTVSARLLSGHRCAAQLVSGLLFGGTCMIGMLTPITSHLGLIFDARTVVLSMAGLFGGPLVAAVAALMAGSYRLWLGGAGALVGLGNVLVPALLGLAYRYLHRHHRVKIGVWQLLLFGLLVHVVALVMMTSLPMAQVSFTFEQVGLPMLLVLPVATVILGLLLEDIERRQRTERALGLSEAHMRAITGAIPDLLLVVDEDGRYLEAVLPGQSRLHAGNAGLVGRRLHEVLSIGEAERFLAFIQKTLASASPQKIEYSMKTLGGPKVFEGRAQRLDTLLDGKRAIVFLARDITERVHVELERRIAAIAFESQQGMVITDACSRILRVNQAFSAITGYSAEDVIGRETRMLSSGRQGPEFYQAMWQSLNETGVWQGEIWNRRKNGETFPEWLSISAVCDAQGLVSNYVSSLTDITERKAAEDRIKHLAFFDALTGLPNRRLLLDRLQQALAASARSGQFGALMFLDLDNFKNINDLHGHQTGDQMLCLAAERLGHAVRASDTVARLGGDEFVVMLENLKSQPEEAAAQAEHIGKQVLAALGEPYQVDSLEMRSSVSIGVVLFKDESCGSDELMKRADLSMYEAKTAGKNALRFFDPHMQEAVSARLRLEEEIRLGLAAEEFVAYFQPQVDANRALIGAEVLVRWRHPQCGLLGPAAFIAVAERAGLIEELDFQMLQQACRQLALWAGQPAMASLSLSVNLSARLLYQADFVDRLLQLLAHSGADPRRLKLELTESLLLDDLPGAVARMASLKTRGIRFAIDDFGTGYSSMAYLQQLPLDQLKVDQSFVRALPGDTGSLAIIRAICALATSLGLDVIAEGVETEAQHKLLLGNGCRHFQGYLFGRPMPLAEFQRLAE